MDNIQQSQDPQNGQLNPEPELTFHDYWLIINRGKLWIISSVIAILMFTVYYNYSVAPQYTATTTLLIKTVPQAATIFDFGGGMGQSTIANQIEILRSRQVATFAVKSLWKTKHRNNLSVFGSRKFLPRGQRPRRIIREIITLGLYNPEADKPAQHNEEYTDKIGRRFSGKIKSTLFVANKRGTDILTVSSTSPFPEEAALIANTVAHEFAKLDAKWGAEQTHNLLYFLKDQLKIKENELTIAEETVKDFMENEKIFDLTGNANLIVSRSTEVESQYYETVAEININLENIRYLHDKLSKEEKQLADLLLNSLNTKVLALRQEISQREGELIRNEGLYGSEHDAVKSTRKRIATLKGQLDEEIQTLISRGVSVADPIEHRQELIGSLLTSQATLAGFRAKADEYQKLIDHYNIQIEKLPQKQMEFARLERDRSVLNETYMFMRQKLEEARVNVASEGGKVQIIDMAIVPNVASSPDKSRNMLFGLILGVGLGAGIVFLKEYLDRTIQSIEWIERFGISVLGVIPIVSGMGMSITSRKRRKKKNASGTKGMKNVRRRLITREDPKSPISESYRTLRTNILYSQADKNIKSVLVSSPSPGEGKTTTIANLAITFANMGKRTLLLDTDLRRPVIHRIFEIKKDPGMSHYLAGNVKDFNDLVQETDVENLWVVSAGITPPNPSELMGSKKMAELVDRLEQEWDMVLLDSPPIVAVTDASMISQEIDAMVMVVKAAETDRDAFRRAVKSLASIKVPLAGVVVNGISRRTSKDTYYYYYQYYQHYYGGYYGYYGKDKDEELETEEA